jgi:hypothetical protein
MLREKPLPLQRKQLKKKGWGSRRIIGKFAYNND